MLSQSRGLRFALVLLMSLGAVAWLGHDRPVYAEEEEEEGGDEGGDEGGEGGGEEGEEEVEEDQPPVTSGGLFSLKTYPIRELSRPLIMTEKITQVRLGVGADVSAKGAFESFGVSLEGEHGFRDNVSGIFGFTSAYNFKQFGLYAGVEAALAYDLVDFRGALRVSRPLGAQDIMTGETSAGKIKASIDLGFPFRYVAKPQIAIVALDTLISIDFDSKPDLNPSLGISTNPIAALSVVIFAQLQIGDFDTDKQFRIPATVRAQFSPSQKLDLGAEFTFLNMKPAEGTKFYDSRFLTLYVQARFGR